MAINQERKRKSVIQTWTGNRPPMKHSDFRIDSEFLTGSGRWRCTDVGKRTIAAIRLEHDNDPAWHNGPPYAVVEHVFDEYGIEGCERALKRRTYDASGRTQVVRVKHQRGARNTEPIRGQKRLVKAKVCPVDN